MAKVIALAPEFIKPQDGSDKQDCEVTAAKRWVQTHAEQFAGQPITLLREATASINTTRSSFGCCAFLIRQDTANILHYAQVQNAPDRTHF